MNLHFLKCFCFPLSKIILEYHKILAREYANAKIFQQSLIKLYLGNGVSSTKKNRNWCSGSFSQVFFTVTRYFLYLNNQ